MQRAPDLQREYRRIRLLRAGREVYRYAPSPTGPLHLGNARTALLAWLQARLTGGVMILRMEDLDVPRTKPGAARAIETDLTWMGLDWDEGGACEGPAAPYDQGSRTDLYRQAFDCLREADLLYPCYCSRKDITQAASAPHFEGLRHIYPGSCRHLPRGSVPPGKSGKRPAWRFRVPERTVIFEDGIMGPQESRLTTDAGDFVVLRADDLYAYQLAVVVDDALMGVTDVLRGADLLDVSARQIELFQALGFVPPRFWHVPLMCDEQGHRMAKRDGSESIQSFRQEGGRPEALIGRLAASLGLVRKGTQLDALSLCRSLDLDRFQKVLRRAAGI